MSIDRTKVRRMLLTATVAALATAAPAPAAASECWYTLQHCGLFCNDGGEMGVCESGDDCTISCGQGAVDGVDCDCQN